jgi:hypothetical protein
MKHASLALTVLATAVMLAIPTQSQAQQSITVYTSEDPALNLGSFAFRGDKTVDLRIGIGSGAYYRKGDPANMIYSVSDRGPNFTCDDEGQEVTGLTPEKMCNATKRGRIYPLPNYVPSIFSVELMPDHTFRIVDIVGLKDRDGKPLTGIVNPLTIASTDIPFDATGKRLPQDPGGVDLEGIVRLQDGTYWLSDENAPGLIHVAADGRVIKRLIPAGTEKDYKGANYDIAASLPAILAKRQGNRGIESVAMSPDETFLYFMVQNPLANPNSATYRDANNTRLFKMERASGKLVGEYVYVLTDPKVFKAKSQSTLRISEMSALGTDRLLVLERTDTITHIYEISLAGATNILGTKWDDLATSPTLEANKVAAEIGITPAPKTLRFDSAKVAEAPVKLEGIAMMVDGSMLLVNDDDFGITGEKTKILVVKDTAIKLTRN